MTMKNSLLIVLLFGGLVACSTNIPKAENFEQTKQRKMMSAQHWNALARDAVTQTRWTLNQKGFSYDTPIYITENTNTVFDYAFRKYLIANFVEDGVMVSTKKGGAIEVNYDTQIIKHAGAFNPSKFGYKPGAASATVGGLWVLRDVLNGGGSALFSSLALAGAYDGYKATNPGETGVELMLTTSIVYEDIYVMHNTDAYYIEQGEAWLFEPCKGRNKRYCK